MAPLLATFVCFAGIFGLIWLDRDPAVRTSPALWLPLVWFLISGSRHVSFWFGMTPAGTSAAYLEGSPLDAIVYAVLLLMAVAVLARRRHAVVALVRRNPALVLFILYCAVSVVWSDFPGVALKRWIKSLGDYSMILLLLTDAQPLAAVRKVLSRVSFILLPLSILFIKYYPQLGRAYASHWEGTVYYTGVSDTKNMLGMVCLVFGFTAFWRLIIARQLPQRQRRKMYAVHGMIVLMAIYLLKVSDSKTSLACFALTGGLLVAHTFSNVFRRRAVLNLTIGLIVGGCVSVLFLGFGSDALSALGRNSTLTGRTDIWDVILSVPVNRVFGTGFESFWLGPRLDYVWSFQVVDGITEAHNGYLEVLLNLGILGELFLAGVLWTGYRNILRSLRAEPDFGRLRLGFFVIALIYNMTEAGIRSTDLIWLSLLIATIAVPQRQLMAVRQTSASAAPPTAQGALASAR